MSVVAVPQQQNRTAGDFLEDLNGHDHRRALWIFMAVVVAHWAEHILQAFQIWVLGWARPDARGALGLVFPWLMKSEALHYFYAIAMLFGLILLRPGFTGRPRAWWDAALIIQFWHHIEHALLLTQAIYHPFFGKKVPTSIAQLAIPRVELHLFYNGIVFIPMVIAMILHVHPSEEDRQEASCSCASKTRQELAGVAS